MKSSPQSVYCIHSVLIKWPHLSGLEAKEYSPDSYYGYRHGLYIGWLLIWLCAHTE